MKGRFRRILVPGRTCWTLRDVRASGLLVDGRAYFREFWKAARRARRTIAAAGWQFDSTVELLRGPDRAAAGGEDVRLLPFLDGLCRRAPELRIYLLCWDYSPGFMLQREWFQARLFSRGDHGRLRFRFDDRHAVGASHHQKFAVIDGRLAFAGSMDLCHDRWDDRAHRAEDSARLQPGRADYGPYHEVQAYLEGPAAAELAELFRARWRSAGGPELDLPPAEGAPVEEPRPSVALGPGSVGLSRTVARTLVPDQPSIREIRRLYVDAIDAAEELIYIESQYFGSAAVYQALLRRMADPRRGRLDIVLVYPRGMHSLTEEFSMGALQCSLFRGLKRAAARTGHDLGIYWVASPGPGGVERDRYIHSKVLVVDDRFLSVGSANTNNRSMGLDTELNVSWEAESPGEAERIAAIRRARVNLLIEHTGRGDEASRRALRRRRGLVRTLDAWAERGRSTLRPHPLTSRVEESPLLRLLDLDHVSFDPERPLLEEEVFEPFRPFFFPTPAALSRRGRRRAGGREQTTRAGIRAPLAVARAPNPVWTLLSRAFKRSAVAVAVIGAVLLAGALVYVAIRTAL
jgi:phosphatidylserine/phosphatidylglycerophosphate/cardiolipin synthase-like enzyme